MEVGRVDGKKNRAQGPAKLRMGEKGISVGA